MKRTGNVITNIILSKIMKPLIKTTITFAAVILLLNFTPAFSAKAATKPDDVISQITKLKKEYKGSILEQSKQFYNTLELVEGMMKQLKEYESLAYSRGGNLRNKNKDVASCISGYNSSLDTAKSLITRFLNRKFILTKSGTKNAAKGLLKTINNIPSGKKVCDTAFKNGRATKENTIRKNLKKMIESLKRTELGSDGKNAKNWLKKTFKKSVNAWCVCYYCYILYSSGYQLWNTNSYQLTGVGYIRDEFKKYGCLYNASQYTPKTGDLIVINKGQHVGCVYKDESTGKLYCFHGNWGKKVQMTEIKNGKVDGSPITYYGNLAQYLLG